MAATPLEIYKAQAMVLVPVVKALEKELGAEKAQRLIRDAIGEHFRSFGNVAFAGTQDEHGVHFGKRIHALMDMFSAGEALEWEVQESSDSNLRFRVNRCKYAEFYKELGAPELGFLFVCYQDYPFTKGMDDRAVLDRPQTIMQGADHCQFNWYLQKDKASAQAARRVQEAKAQGSTEASS